MFQRGISIRLFSGLVVVICFRMCHLGVSWDDPRGCTVLVFGV